MRSRPNGKGQTLGASQGGNQAGIDDRSLNLAGRQLTPNDKVPVPVMGLTVTVTDVVSPVLTCAIVVPVPRGDSPQFPSTCNPHSPCLCCIHGKAPSPLPRASASSPSDLAQREDRPVSELVRSAVDLWLSRHDADLPMGHDGPPIFHGGPVLIPASALREAAYEKDDLP